MYRRETRKRRHMPGNRTRRTDSVKQHEMAALREMEQMVLAAENSEGTAGLEKAVAHLESFLQQGQKDPYPGRETACHGGVPGKV